MNREHYIVNGLVNETVKTQMKNSLEKIDGVNSVLAIEKYLGPGINQDFLPADILNQLK